MTISKLGELGFDSDVLVLSFLEELVDWVGEGCEEVVVDEVLVFTCTVTWSEIEFP